MRTRGKGLLYVAVPVLVITVMLIAGCNEEGANQAITVAKTPGPLSSDFSVPVQLADGTMTTISKLGKPFYVIAFVETPADDPCYVSPEVQKIARRLWLDSVTVIQVSEPSSSKMFTENIMNVCKPPNANLVRIFDQDKRAWNRFNRPKLGTLLLIDPHGNVTSSGTLSNPEDVLFDTERQAKRWNEIWSTDIREVY